MKSRHDNGHEDRVWTPVCGVLTQNPPDWDDCSEINIVDVILGDLELGERKTEKVAKYSLTSNACGNSLTAEQSTINIESSEQVSTTESLELEKRLQDTFQFSSTMETSFKMTSSVSGEVEQGVVKATATLGMEFGLKASFTTDRGVTMSSGEKKTSGTGTVELNVMSTESTFKPEPYQWREARATYTKQNVIVPLRLKMQCIRKDGVPNVQWVDSNLKAAAFSQVTVEVVDKTKECP